MTPMSRNPRNTPPSPAQPAPFKTNTPSPTSPPMSKLASAPIPVPAMAILPVDANLNSSVNSLGRHSSGANSSAGLGMSTSSQTRYRRNPYDLDNNKVIVADQPIRTPTRSDCSRSDRALSASTSSSSLGDRVPHQPQPIDQAIVPNLVPADRQEETPPLLTSDEEQEEDGPTTTLTLGGPIHSQALLGSGVRFLPFDAAMASPVPRPETSNDTVSTTKLFLGHLDFHVDERQLVWLVYTICGVKIFNFNRITGTKVKPGAKLPLACYHCWVASDQVDMVVKAFDSTVILEKTGAWVASTEPQRGVLQRYSHKMRHETPELQVLGSPYGLMTVEVATNKGKADGDATRRKKPEN